MSLETVPKDVRHLRACLLCSLVKTIDQFEYDGCDNCNTYIQMKGNRELVYECTSSSFDGVVAMMTFEDSWVAKWQRISTFKPGVYAVSVTGRLPQVKCNWWKISRRFCPDEFPKEISDGQKHVG